MSIPESEPHVRALVDLLAARLPQTVTVSLGIAPPEGPPCVVLYPDPGDVHDARLAGDRSRVVLHFICHAIGVGPEQVFWVTDHARAALLGAPPVVAGRVIHRLRQTVGSEPVQRDATVQPPLYFQPTEFRLMSQAA